MTVESNIVQIDRNLTIFQSMQEGHTEVFQKLDIVQTVYKSDVIYENGELRNSMLNEKCYGSTYPSKSNTINQKSIDIVERKKRKRSHSKNIFPRTEGQKKLETRID